MDKALAAIVLAPTGKKMKMRVKAVVNFWPIPPERWVS